MNSHNKVYKTSQIITEGRVEIFQKQFYSKKLCVHNACAKRKRCYDVTLSRQEGSTMRHLASAQWDWPACEGIIHSHKMTFPVIKDQIRDLLVNLLIQN